MADALHGWAINSWQPLAEHREKTMKSWLHTTRHGENIIFSMLLDIAFLLGEVIRRGNSYWHWGIDLSEVNLRDGMASARRIVLLAAPVGKHLETFDLDIEAIVVDLFLHGNQVTQNFKIIFVSRWKKLFVAITRPSGNRRRYSYPWKHDLSPMLSSSPVMGFFLYLKTLIFFDARDGWGIGRRIILPMPGVFPLFFFVSGVLCLLCKSLLAPEWSPSLCNWINLRLDCARKISKLLGALALAID